MQLKENIKNGFVKHPTEFHVERNGDELVFSFLACDSGFYSAGNNYNDPIYDGSVVEIFLSYGIKNHYYEIEVAPNGTVFLADIENINNQTKINFINDCFIKTSVKKTANNYSVTISFPLNKIKTEEPKFNAFRIEFVDNKQYLYALNPTMCDSFHRIEAFIDLLSLL